MSKARDISNLFSASTSAATDTEVTSAISTHASNTTNRHYKTGNTSSRPGSPNVGDLYFDTELDGFIQYTENEGWKLIGSVGEPKPTVTGGTLASDSTYYYRTFTSNGTLTIQNASLSVDYLVIAGGGAGAWHTNDGSNYGGPGGGGAGGYRTSIGGSPLSLTAQSYTVTVGAGGVVNAGKGSDSVFSTITSTGGGGGGLWTGGSGSSGGSGGGGSSSYIGNPGDNGGAGNTPATSPSQGNNGGTGNYDGSQTARGGGGGGGAGGVGGNGSTSGAGAGGVGSSSASAWGLATNTGENISGTVYYAGGGGGSTGASNSSNVGGYGGGGAGGYGQYPPPRNGIAGTANTGGGGGSGDTAGNGGSGIVIIRYLKTAVN